MYSVLYDIYIYLYIMYVNIKIEANHVPQNVSFTQQLIIINKSSQKEGHPFGWCVGICVSLIATLNYGESILIFFLGLLFH